MVLAATVYFSWLDNVITCAVGCCARISLTALISQAGTPGQELTFTCVPPGSGVRLGIDRDLDEVLDGDSGTN